MPIISGQDAGGQSVWQFADGTIVPLSVAIDSDKNIVAIATEEKQDDIISELSPVADTPEYFEDTNFVTGESPAILDFNNALGRNATQGTLVNDGPGDFTVSFSVDGTNFGDEITVEINESIHFKKISVDSIRITWVANSAYRVVVI